MADDQNTRDGYQGQPLPDCPEVAIFVWSLLNFLGGGISIDDGRRRVSRPEAALYRLQGKELPQLPGAEPHEQFRNDDEWRGAQKVAEYWLSRLSPADQDYVFAAFARANAHPGSGFDFRERLR